MKARTEHRGFWKVAEGDLGDAPISSFGGGVRLAGAGGGDEIVNMVEGGIGYIMIRER